MYVMYVMNVMYVLYVMYVVYIMYACMCYVWYAAGERARRLRDLRSLASRKVRPESELSKSRDSNQEGGRVLLTDMLLPRIVRQGTVSQQANGCPMSTGG